MKYEKWHGSLGLSTSDKVFALIAALAEAESRLLNAGDKDGVKKARWAIKIAEGVIDEIAGMEQYVKELDLELYESRRQAKQ